MSEESVDSPPSPPSPISESFRKHMLNMERLTGLNYVEWLRNWRLLYDEHDFLIDESEKVRDLMLLTIDPEFRRDFEFLGPYELIQLVEERFREQVEEEQTRIFKRLAGCKLEEGSSVGSHTYKKGNQEKTLMEMRSMLTLYESLMERHSSTNLDTLELSPVRRRNKKRSRSSRHVLRYLKLGIHRIGYSHRKIGRRSKDKSFGNSRTRLGTGVTIANFGQQKSTVVKRSVRQSIC
ncbi:hypothetical protein L1887_28541 [Cichorium endivia]|nr:hypothetical protein L1887_28541 [Cichorium endivia]